MKKKAKAKKAKRISGDEMLTLAMESHAESGVAWERDFGDRSVVDYGTMKTVAKTAREYRRKMGL